MDLKLSNARKYSVVEAMIINKKPTVSVVIPTYGRALMVRQAILSAFAQDLVPDEVVVSDDRSPDNTLEILNELAEKFPDLKVIKSTSNSGGVANWNKVIDAASGDYIAYCSDDDYFMPHHLKTAIDFLEKNPEVSLVHSGFFNLTQSDQDFSRASIELINDEIFVISGKDAIKHIVNQTSYPFQPSTFVFRRCLWESIGPFNPKYTVADTDWFIKAGLTNKIAYLPVASVVNRRHPHNWSNRVGSIGMNLEFHNMIREAMNEVSKTTSRQQYIFLRSSWLITDLVKFIRIYVARSRAGLYDVSQDCANAIWKILFGDRRGIVYDAFTVITFYVSKILGAVQKVLPGGKSKYENLGKHVPK